MGVSEVFDNITGIHEAVAAVQTATGGAFLLFFLLIVWFIAFISFTRYGTNQAMMGSSGLCTFLALMAWAGGYLRGEFAVIPVVVLGITVFVYWLNKP